MKESEILVDIQVKLSRMFPIRLWRNNVGQLKNDRGQYVRYGLCEGSSDLIGLTPITVTPEMVGQKMAVFTAIEVKAERGKLSLDQQNFLSVIRGLGGIAFCARSAEEAVECLNGEVIINGLQRS